MSPETLEARASTGPNAWLYREALQNGYVNHGLSVRNTGVYYCALFTDDREIQLRCYLNESLLTALEHDDPLIRVRATLQAYAYSGRLEGMGKTPGPRHCDALLEARNRLEAEVRRVA